MDEERTGESGLLTEIDYLELEDAARALTEVSDEVLVELAEAAAELVARFARPGVPHRDQTPAARYLFHQLKGDIARERCRREELYDHARTQVEANGHEVMISGTVEGGRDGPWRWSVLCSCQPSLLLFGHLHSYDAAVWLADAHALANDGRWAQDQPAPPESYRH